MNTPRATYRVQLGPGFVVGGQGAGTDLVVVLAQAPDAANQAGTGLPDVDGDGGQELLTASDAVQVLGGLLAGALVWTILQQQRPYRAEIPPPMEPRAITPRGDLAADEAAAVHSSE